MSVSAWLSNKKYRQQRLTGLTVGACLFGVLLFQNCGPGFEVLNSTLESVSEIEIEPSLTKYEDGDHVIIGDMVLPQKVYADLRAPKAIGKVDAFGQLPSTLKSWPGGIVPISIPRQIFRAEIRDGRNQLFAVRDATTAEYDAFRNAIQTACTTVSQVANVRCEISLVPPTTLIDGQLTALLLSNDDSVWCGTDINTSCARIGGPGTTDSQGVALVRPWMAIREKHVREPGLLLHEFGHVLGLLHEHQRADAGNYLLVSPAIPQEQRAAYLRLNSYTGVIPDMNFDFGSMMMYPAQGEVNAGFLAGTSSLAIRKEFWANGGQRQMARRGMDNTVARPSVQDVSILQSVYGPPESPVGKASCSLGSRVIPHGSYISVYGPEAAAANGYATCTTAVRNCNNGVLSGAGDKLTCDISCTDGKAKVAYAFSQTFYETSSVPAGQSCRSQVRQCTAQGLSVPAGQSPYRESSCSVVGAPTPTPVAKVCVAGSLNYQSLPNSVGMRTTCVATWSDAMPNPTVRVVATVTNGGTTSAICQADGSFTDIQQTCPAPANPTPTPTPSAGTPMCPAGSETVMSTPNNIGNRTSCVANWSSAFPSPNRVSGTVTNGGSYSGVCASGGVWSSIAKNCPPPADMVEATPTPPPSPTPVAGAANCLATAVQAWTVGGLNCTAPGPAMVAGDVRELTNTISGIVGKATFRCDNGTRVVQTSPAATCAFLSAVIPIIDTTLSAPVKAISTGDAKQSIQIRQGRPPFRMRISGPGDHVRFENGLDQIVTSNRSLGLVYRYTSTINNGIYTVQVIDADNWVNSKNVIINVAARPSTPTVEQMECTVTKRMLSSYSMDGKIIPTSAHAGSAGRYFVAGFDPNEQAWWSFDGAAWFKHDGQDANFKALEGLTSLAAGGIAGAVFVDANLSIFPRGILYVGYGVGATQSAAWSEMLGQNRYRICDVLPAN